MKKLNFKALKIEDSPIKQAKIKINGEEFEIDYRALRGESLLRVSVKLDGEIPPITEILIGGLLPKPTKEDVEKLINIDAKAALEIMKLIIEETEGFSKLIEKEKENAKESLKSRGRIGDIDYLSRQETSLVLTENLLGTSVF